MRLPPPVAVRALLVLAVALLFAGCATRHAGPPSPHFDGRRFADPDAPPDKGFGAFLRWRFGPDEAAPWPEAVPGAKDAPPPRVDGDAMRVSMVGHATVLVQTAGLNLLTDPVWSDRASPLAFAGPKRVTPPGIDFDALPKIDVVLVSHNHYDHLDTDTLARLWARDRPLMVAPLGNAATMRAKARDMAVVELDWGQSHRQVLPSGEVVTLTASPMQHWSARGLFDRRLSLWAAFTVATPSGAIHFVGDSGYGEGRHYRAAGAAIRDLRLAILPIGAYAPRWFMQDNHQTPEEALRARADLRAPFALAHHHGVFPMADESQDEPARRLEAERARRGLPEDAFRVLRPGEAWWVPRPQAPR